MKVGHHPAATVLAGIAAPALQELEKRADRGPRWGFPTLVAVVTIAGLHGNAAIAQSPPSDAAVTAVALPEPQLRGMLARVIFSTQTMGMATYTLGIPAACDVTRPAFESAVAQVLPRWRTNLVRAYRSNVPVQVLAQASAGGPVAGAPMIAPYLAQIGAEMQKASEPLLAEAAAAVLEPVLTAAAMHDRKAVDGVARMAEMKAGRSDGTLYCGLQPVAKEPN